VLCVGIPFTGRPRFFVKRFFVKRMSETNYGQHGNEGPAPHGVHHPYWRRAHHDWRFWAGLILMLAAITIYVLSDDLALLPRR